MTKIAVYQVREEELLIVEKWSKDNNVEVKIIDGQLTPENVHLAKGFDGVTTSQNTKVSSEVYKKLNECILQDFSTQHCSDKLHNFAPERFF